ncbi:MAG TPA: haloperoxidase, partial [Chitinophagaceae bacterium]
MKRLLIILLLFIAFHAEAQPGTGDADKFRKLVFSLTKVMYHDVVNPPAAARFYAYCMLASYEAQYQLKKEMPDFHHNFKGYVPVKPIADTHMIDEPFAVLYALMETARNILPSGYRLAEEQQDLVNEFRKKSATAVIAASIAFATRISANIIKYAKPDGYFKLSALPRYSLKKEEGAWRPTPPEYMAAVEPNWKTIRTFFLDSARQFTSIPAVKFDTSKGSSFHALVNEVYTTGKNLSEEQQLIANYWDCNPFAVQFAG